NPGISLDFINNKGERVSGKYQDLKEKYPFLEIKKGLQSLTAPLEAIYFLKKGSCLKCGSQQTLQETDTFDTWFLSGQWPLTTLGYPKKKDFQYFYPTSVLDTLWDILFFWVARMMILGLYLTKEVPFKVIHLHARVVDKQGQKMSKSKGNVINPMEMIKVYGADPLRMALIIGVSPGSDIALSDNKVRAMGNFANKTWNIGRFILKNLKSSHKKVPFYTPKMEAKLTREDKKILKDLNQLVKKTTRHLETYRFDLAADHLYHFLWHRFADEYLENSKERIKEEDIIVLAILRHVYLNCLKLLHPFMPFITEEIWQKFPKKFDQPLIISQWPK
ncbi:MAG TPA: class I tRNA ligase family protein, partial [Candidatus Bathyarchaeia archaeon]|nr:class I tRNA ligase family protein [Candidatus Bathyarchaeia archaeon]